MNKTLRTFRIIKVIIKNKSIIVKDKNKFTSKYGARQAASKGWTAYCNKLNVGATCKGEIHVQDITPKGKHKGKLYAYSVKRIKALPGAYKRGKKGIVQFRYENVIKRQ